MKYLKKSSVPVNYFTQEKITRIFMEFVLIFQKDKMILNFPYTYIYIYIFKYLYYLKIYVYADS